MPETNALDSPEVTDVLAQLHAGARRDIPRFLTFLPEVVGGLLRGRGPVESVTSDPIRLRDCYLAVPPEEGRFLYLTARAIRATTVVEFGTSFGISTVYLAAAVHDNGGGVVVGTEMEEHKHEAAVESLERAGFGDIADVRLGDALETLADDPTDIDLVFLDGWKDLYLPVLELLTPRLRPGAVVLADNIKTFKSALAPYVEFVQGDHGFVSSTMPISDGVEYSIYVVGT